MPSSSILYWTVCRQLISIWRKGCVSCVAIEQRLCTPAPHTPASQSMLDWYFDCEGLDYSLRQWLTEALVVAGRAVLPLKPHRYHDATNGERCALYTTFHGFLKTFREKVQSFAANYRENLTGQHPESHIWLRYDYYALDLHNAKPGDEAQVWLGLGRLEDGFRSPVAIKRNRDDKDAEQREQHQFMLKRVMRKLKPGSFIASAELVEIESLSWPEPAPIKRQPASTQSKVWSQLAAAAATKQKAAAEPADEPVQRNASAAKQYRWVSEAGVCTLKELFVRKFNGHDGHECRSKMHKMLVKEILQSMVLAVYHLHECKIVHKKIGLSYFKVFLIEEPPRSTNLRVKLVSMKDAVVFPTDGTAEALVTKDIHDLGCAMMEVVLGDKKQFEPQNPSSMDEAAKIKFTQEKMLSAIQTYDPSLFLLLHWIFSIDGARLDDIIRHPYFMSLNEKEAFTLALEGDVFASIATALEVRTPFFTALIICTTLNLTFSLCFSPISSTVLWAI